MALVNTKMFIQVGSPIFGDWNGTHTYKTWNKTICDTIDNGDYEDEQLYVQEVVTYYQDNGLQN